MFVSIKDSKIQALKSIYLTQRYIHTDSSPTMFALKKSTVTIHSVYGCVYLQLNPFLYDGHANVYFILLSLSNRKYESLTIV